MGMRVMCRIFPSNSGNSAQPLYYPALIGLRQIIENMMPKIINVHTVKERYCTALPAALVDSYEEVIQILLKAMTDVKLKEDIIVAYVALVCMI